MLNVYIVLILIDVVIVFIIYNLWTLIPYTRLIGTQNILHNYAGITFYHICSKVTSYNRPKLHLDSIIISVQHT